MFQRQEFSGTGAEPLVMVARWRSLQGVSAQHHGTAQLVHFEGAHSLPLQCVCDADAHMHVHYYRLYYRCEV